MSRVLDIQLPPLAALTATSSLAYRLSDRQGSLLSSGEATRGELAGQARGARWRLHLHEDDSLALPIALPPLAGKRLQAAARCAVQGLLLGDAGQVHMAHGPRQADGQVVVAWLGQAELKQLQDWLRGERVSLGGLFAHPGDARPAVDLAGGLQGPATPVAWGRTLSIWGVALAIWCLGLNLYAGHLADEGERLRARMVAQVRQAFPQLPVVLNPLQQARQQLQGRSGRPGLDGLLDGAGQAMPFLAGNVAALDYQDGVLQVTVQTEGTKLPTDSSWQAELATRGIEASASGQGWALRAGTPVNQELAHVD
jgi:general secretion pathway protein L